MKEKLEAILRTLENARRQITDVKENGADLDGQLDDIEMGIDWIKKKLEELRDSDHAG